VKDFSELVRQIEGLHTKLQASAAQSVNIILTVRNWLIGKYIIEFEQNGKDRASYGSSLLEKLAKSLSIKGLTAPELSRCRQFYRVYPQILETLSQELTAYLPPQILGTLSQKSDTGTEAKAEDSLAVPSEILISRLSFSHFAELIKIDDSLKRCFYEIECSRGTWSVRELKRQINSLYFERSGLSKNPEKLAVQTLSKTLPQKSSEIIKNIYTFDFLGLKSNQIVEESDLETALIDHLHEFIIELGNGFCFEARQKKILIGENYYFIDLLFYHRILKCHVLIELKLGEFAHGDIGQLNTYLNYFKDQVCEENDNPPVGILLVAEKDHALVKYATAGMDENLFVKQYLIQLPAIEELKRYIEKELESLK
jgi:predicted nuclease of restriction endonuclease-like (RecB) superfamily